MLLLVYIVGVGLVVGALALWGRLLHEMKQIDE